MRKLADALLLPSRMVVGWRRRSLRRADSFPVLGFGGVLENSSMVHGGAVKLLTLREAFATDERTFSVLYAVSSALPAFPRDLVSHCRGLGIPFVWNQNGVGYPAWAGSCYKEVNAPMQRLHAEADTVIYQSDFCRRSAEKFLGSRCGPSTVLMNPVDLDAFAPPKEPLPERPLRLLAMGTQNYPERAFCAIDAAGHLLREGIECSLTLAGKLLWKGGEAHVRERARAAGLGERFHWRGPFGRDDAVHLCQSHHLLIHPKYKDPCPTVVAEALACGLPVVASSSGGLPEMVDEECAVLLPVEETWEALPTPSGPQIAEAVADLSTRLAMASAAARRRAESHFDEKAWIRAHQKIFRGVVVSGC